MDETTDLAHARELARRAADEERIAVAVSGDGMIGAIADELRELPGAVVGIVPGGRGNDLARVLGIPTDPLAAANVLLDGIERAVDVGLVEPAVGPARAFVGIASAGFDSDANRIANEAPAWLGGAVYAYGALRALVAWRPARLTALTDDERFEFQGYSFAAASSRAYGGGMFVAPDALLDDGLLDIVCVADGSKLQFLANLPRVFSGTHVHEASVRVLRARSVRLEADRDFVVYADGDPIGPLPATVTALAGAITVICPPEVASAFGAAT